jgi:1,2-diacylglycerol 3-beta-galactosyltransferase
MAKRILILTAAMGLGHLSAAKAVAAALEQRYGEQCEVEIVNPMEDERTPSFLRQLEGNYDRSVREQPDLYRVGYGISENEVAGAVLDSAMTLLLLDVLNETIKTHQPDIIVVTRENYLAPLSGLMAVNKLLNSAQQRIPVVTAVTDLTTVHRSWFNPVSRLCFVPTQPAYDLAISNGLNSKKVKITGVPVDPVFAQEARKKDELRARLGWDSQLATLLVVGGKRVRGVRDLLHVLNHSALPLQLVVVAGGDDELYEESRAFEWHMKAHLYNLVDNMPALMRAADAVACKAGGLVVSEALASALPILLIDVIQGQETGNADYVVNGGAGDLALEPVAALEALFHWLQGRGKLLKERARNAKRLGHPNAAWEIAGMIWKVMNESDKPDQTPPST